MAGIGFELKKLYKNSGLLSTAKAHLYSIFVTVGPIVISVVVITFLQFILKNIGVERLERDILQATIMYSFVFSVILASGYSMLLSRYLSDKLYLGRTEDILPAMYGSLSLVLLFSGILALVFYYFSPLPLIYKLFAYLLFIELLIEIVLSVFVSALKNFKAVAYSFLYGTILGTFCGYLLKSMLAVKIITAVLIGFDICLLVVIILLTREIQQYFNVKSTLYYTFLSYFDRHYLIFFTNLFYTVGLYAHNFIFWRIPDLNHVVENTYIFTPYYDNPAFYAFLSIIPSMVMFVVKVETEFYESYRNYFYLINNGACYEDIEAAKKEMKRIMYKELSYLMEIQLFFTIAFIILGMKLLPLVGFTPSMVDLYSILALGYYCVIIMFIVMTLLLYFDNQKSACLIAFLFLVLSIIFTLATVYLGESYYGLGLFAAGLSSLIFSLVQLVRYLNSIDYYVFCIQVQWKEKEGGPLARLLERINSLGAGWI